MSCHGAIAVGGCAGDNNHAAKKRRRWSTAQQEAVLAPNRFGVKKQQKILGRHHPSSNSVNSLASFQSNSNPIFEPSEPPYSSINSNPDRLSEGLRQAEERRLQSFKWYSVSNGATLVTTADDLSRGGGGAGGAEQHQSHPKVKSRLGKVSPDSSLFSSHSGGEWGEEEEDNGVENPLLLLHCNSPAITGKRAGVGLQEESREKNSGNYDEEWPVEEEGPNEGDSGLGAVSPELTNSDGAQSIHGPRHLLANGSFQGEEELSTLEACERRSRELVEKVQANAAAELANLRAYKALIEKLRVDCTKHEAAAKEYAELHRDTVAQLVTAKSEITELERQRGLQSIAIDEFKQKLGVGKDLQDAMVVSDKLKLETLEKEQDAWRKKVHALEMELMAAKSELSAVAIREECKEAEAKLEAEHGVSTQDDEGRKVDLEEEARLGAVESGGETEAGSNNTILGSASGRALSAQRLCEVETQLATVCEQMEMLQRERHELRMAVQDGEKRVAEAEKERDAVVLVVQQEWDSVKVALREEKEKLKRELEVVREENTMGRDDLDTKNRILEEVKRSDNGRLECPGEKSLQVFIGDQIVESGTERGDSLIALWNDYQKLEVELSEAFDHNKKQRSDREALNVALSGVREGNKKLEGEREALNAALIGVRDGNKKLEGELGDLQVEKTKLERERDALMTAVQEERQKLENERAVVCRAMKGENEKLESEREVLIAMQEYLKKLEMKQDLVQTSVGGDEKRRRKGKLGATLN